MGLADKAAKVLRAVLEEAKATGAAVGKVGGGAGRGAKTAFELARGKGPVTASKGMVESLARGVAGGAKGAAGAFGDLSTADKLRAGGAGAGGLLATIGLMSGGDDDQVAEISQRSGLPLGGLNTARDAMLPGVQSSLERETTSNRSASKILDRIERDIYEPLAMRTNNMGEGEADDLYGLTEKMARILYADAPDEDKVNALYELSSME